MELKFVTTAKVGNADAYRTRPLRWKTFARMMRWMIGCTLAKYIEWRELLVKPRGLLSLLILQRRGKAPKFASNRRMFG